MLDKDIEEFLRMGPVEFDQEENGWRSLVGNTDEKDIARLILKYTELSRNKINDYNKDKTGKEIFPIGLLHFHAGQSFCYAGTKYYKDAISCFQKSYERNSECWNAYVDGTIAFLNGSHEEVERQVEIVENSKSENRKGGNIGILKNFSKCLNQGVKDYSKAYSLPTDI